MACGVYMDQNGNVGIMNSWNGTNYDITGTYDPYISTWDATGTSAGKLQIYKLVDSLDINDSLDSINFVSSLKINRFNDVFDDPLIASDNNFSLSTQILKWTGIPEPYYINEFPDGHWGVWQSVLGGTISVRLI